MVEVNVCIGTACHLRGSYNVVQAFQQQIEQNSLHEKVDFKTSFCMRECHGQGVAVSVNGQHYSVEAGKAREFFCSTVLPLAE